MSNSKKRRAATRPSEEDIVYKNTATFPEAIENLKENNIEILKDNILIYIPHVEIVDEKPEQLIGSTTEDDLQDDLQDFFFEVVGLSKEVSNISIGDKVYIEPARIATSVSPFRVGKLNYMMANDRVIQAIKRK